jgi:hypothetical protein
MRIETAHDLSDLLNCVVDRIEKEGDALDLEGRGEV